MQERYIYTSCSDKSLTVEVVSAWLMWQNKNNSLAALYTPQILLELISISFLSLSSQHILLEEFVGDVDLVIFQPMYLNHA